MKTIKEIKVLCSYHPLEEITALLKLDGMELEWRVLIKQKGIAGVVAIAYEDTPEKTLLTAWKNYEDNRRNHSVA